MRSVHCHRSRVQKRVCSQVEHILAEKSTLEQVDNPGFVNLYGSFQDDECIYLAMEFVPGGEFFSHLKARKRCAASACEIRTLGCTMFLGC